MNTNQDIDVDAVPVDSSEEEFEANGREPTELLSDSLCKADPDTDAKIEKFIDLLKPYIEENGKWYNLKLDNIDFLIIYDENDRIKALQIKEELSKVRFRIRNKEHALRVNLLHEDIPGGPFGLDQIYQQSLFILLYITDNFCDRWDNLHTSLTCLKEDLDKKDNSNICSIIVKNLNRKLPMKLHNEIKQIEIRQVRKLMEDESREYLIREQALRTRRIKALEYIEWPSPPVTTKPSSVQPEQIPTNEMQNLRLK